MNAEITIPAGHWLGVKPEDRSYIPTWESGLRRRIAEQPDPAKRFDAWLSKTAEGETQAGARVVFIEQPYLGWAEKVEKAIVLSEAFLRRQIACQIENQE